MNQPLCSLAWEQTTERDFESPAMKLTSDSESLHAKLDDFDFILRSHERAMHYIAAGNRMLERSKMSQQYHDLPRAWLQWSTASRLFVWAVRSLPLK